VHSPVGEGVVVFLFSLKKQLGIIMAAARTSGAAGTNGGRVWVGTVLRRGAARNAGEEISAEELAQVQQANQKRQQNKTTTTTTAMSSPLCRHCVRRRIAPARGLYACAAPSASPSGEGSIVSLLWWLFCSWGFWRGVRDINDTGSCKGSRRTYLPTTLQLAMGGGVATVTG